MTSKNKNSTLSSVRWSAISKYGAQLLQVAVSLVLAKLLDPADFGLLGIAILYSDFVRTLCNMGFRAIIIQRKELDEISISTVFWMNFIVCALMGVLLLAFAPFVGQLYNESRLAPIIACLSICVFANILTVIPSALLQRQLDFKLLAIREIGCAIVTGVVGIALAFLGFGVWALVMSTVANAVMQMVLFNYALPTKIKMHCDFGLVRTFLNFGINISGVDVLRFMTRNADVALIGALLGPTALGFYAFATRLTRLPSEAIAQIVTRVLFPKLCSEQESSVRMMEIVNKTSTMIIFLVVPSVAALAIFCEPIILTVFGEKWMASVPLIWLLSPGAIAMCLMPIPAQLLLAKGKSHEVLRLNALLTGTALLGVFVGSVWDINGIAAAMSVTQLASTGIGFWLAHNELEVRKASPLVSTLFLSVATSVVAAVVVHYLNWFIAVRLDSIACLILEGTVFITMTLIFALCLQRSELRSVCELLVPSGGPRKGSSQLS